MKPAVAIKAILVALGFAAATAQATDFYWSGAGATSDNIDQNDNWFSGSHPSSGDNLYFNNTTGSRHWPYSNYGAGSYFNYVITYSGAGGIKWRGDTTYANKFENNNDPFLFEIEANIGNRSGPDNDLELNPVGSGGLQLDNSVTITGGKTIKVYGNYTLTLLGPVSGAGANLLLNPSGGYTPTVVMSGTNTYTGTTTVNGGTLSLTGAGAITGGGNVTVGNTAGTAYLTMANGTKLTAPEFVVGNGDGSNTKGTAIMNGGYLSATNWLIVGRRAGTGFFNQTGGTVTNSSTATGYVAVGWGYSGTTSVGTYTLSGNAQLIANSAVTENGIATSILIGDQGGADKGTMVLSNNAVVKAANNVVLGMYSGSAGTLSINDNSSFSVGAALKLGVNSGANGTLTMNGGNLWANTIQYGSGSGTITLSGGTLGAYNADATWSAAMVLTNTPGAGNVTFLAQDQANNARTITASGVLSGNGQLTKTGSGTLTLSVANTYSGGTTLSNGWLVVANNSALGNSSGALTLAGGTLQPSSAGDIALANSVIVSANTTNVLDTPKNLTLNGNLSGSGVIVRGTTLNSVVLGGDNSAFSGMYTSPANNNAVIRFASATAGSANAVWFLNNAQGTRQTLEFDNGTIHFGSFNGAGVFNNNGGLSSVTNVMVLGELNGANDSWSGSIRDGGRIMSVIKAGTGTQTFSGANTYTGSTTVTNGTLVLQNTYASPSFIIGSQGVLEINVASGTRDSAATTFSGAGTFTKTGGGTLVWGTTATTFSLSTGAWINVQGGVFIGGSNGNENWANNYASLIISNGAKFDGVEAGVQMDALVGSGVLAGGYSGVGSTDTVGVAGGSGGFAGVITNSSAPLSLVKAGTGTQTLTGTNFFTGFLMINGGTLTIGGAGLLGNGNYSGNISNSANFVSGSSAAQTLGGVISGSGAIIQNGSGTTTLTGVNTFTGGLTIQAGALTIGSAGQLGSGNYTTVITNNANLVYASSAGQTLSGIISGTGVIIQNGSGGLTLSGANTYGGGTIISNSTVTVGNNQAFGYGAVTLAGGVVNNSGGYTLSNNFVVSAGTTSGIRLGGANNLTLNGNFSGSGSLTLGNQNSNASIYLNGTNNMTGGTITFANNVNAVRIGSAAWGSTNVAFVFNNTTNNKDTLDFGAGTIYFGSMTGNGTLIGNSGGLHMISAGALGSNDTFSGVLNDGNGGGTIGLTKVGTGTMILSGANGYTGGTAISNGTLYISTVNNLGASGGGLTFGGGALETTNSFTLNNRPVTLNAGGGTFNIDQLSALTITNNVTGANALTKIGAGTLILAGSGVTYSGATTNTAGTLVLSNTTAFASSAITNTSNLLVKLDTGNTQTYNNLISGAGSLNKDGAGSLTLSGPNTYSGGTTLSNGWLTVGHNTALGGGALTLSGGTLNNNGGVTLANNITVSANTTNVIDTVNNNITLNGNLSGGGVIVRGPSTALPYSLYIGGDNSGFSGVYTSTVAANAATRFTSSTAGSAGAAWFLNNSTATRQTLEFNNGTIHFGGFNGSGQFNNNGGSAGQTNTIVIGEFNGVNDRYSGAIVDGTAQSLAIIKLGTGTQIFSGTNTYSGATAINAGTLRVTGMIAGLGGVTVASAGSLSGSGVVSGKVTNAGIVYADSATPLRLYGSYLINQASGIVTANNAGLVVGGVFTNAGKFVALNSVGTFGTVVNSGAWITDPTTLTFTNSLMVTSSGSISMTAGDVYIFTNGTSTVGSFINDSSQSNTTSLLPGKFVFDSTLALTQQFATAGDNIGNLDTDGGFNTVLVDTLNTSLLAQYSNNFALGTLQLSGISTTMVYDSFLVGGRSHGGLESALFLDTLNLDLGTFLIISNNVQVYYINSNGFNATQVQLIGNGGLHQLITEFSAIPEPNVILLWLSSLVTIYAARRRKRA